MRHVFVLATLVLSACGTSEDRYWERFETTYCEAYDECHTGDGRCPFSGNYVKPDDLSCTFDKKKARECLKGDFVCHSDFGLGSEWIAAPEVCAEVYACNVQDTDTDTGDTGGE